MAKQCGEQPITGNFGGVCFYEMHGVYYARMASSLTGKRVKRDPKFKRTMQLAGIFGTANKIASTVYRQLPAEERGRDMRYDLIRRARKLLEEGFNPDKVMLLLGDTRSHEVIGEAILKDVTVKEHCGKGGDIIEFESNGVGKPDPVGTEFADRSLNLGNCKDEFCQLGYLRRK